ncbi:hypothetical protein PJX95_10155 [Serratia rubidaea]|uniref:hypothetical protein n=1 Tax=Serratia rubidaea TaxID=61652 RepID=UPI002348FE05|nr:hypothetical protein [Serratia rubidaea]MDC6118412.1 hypothetical protein [Serratia rubidaea]
MENNKKEKLSIGKRMFHSLLEYAVSLLGGALFFYVSIGSSTLKHGMNDLYTLPLVSPPYTLLLKFSLTDPMSSILIDSDPIAEGRHLTASAFLLLSR